MTIPLDPSAVQDTPPQGGPSGDAGGHSNGAAGGAADRAALLGQLPERTRALLSEAPDDVLATAVEDFTKAGMLRSDYDRKRQAESQQLAQLQAELERARAREEVYQQQLSSTPNGGAPAAAPTVDELSAKLLETTDPREHRMLLEQLVDARASALVGQALENHPVLRQAQLAMAADRARPADMPVDVYRAGYAKLLSDLQGRGLNPARIDPGVVEFLTPYWAELEQLRAQRTAPSPGPLKNTPAAFRAPTATPSSSGPSPATRVDPGVQKQFGPGSTLADRVRATLAQLGMTPGDLARMRSEEG